MAPIDEALADLESRNPEEPPLYQQTAKKYGCSCTTMARRHQGKLQPANTKITNQHKLTPHKEAELVRYIKELLSGCRPTPTAPKQPQKGTNNRR